MPRVSSAMSGFFFCGIKLEPVENGVAKLDETKFARAPDDQVFAQAREMKSDHGQAKKKFANKVAIGNSIETVLTYAGEAELARNQLAIEHDGRAGERSGTKRQDIDPLQAIIEAACVTREGLDLRQQVVRKKNRLGALHVRVARHDKIDMCLGQTEQGKLQGAQPRAHLRCFRLYVKAEIEGDLVVSAPSGLQFSSGRADAFRQAPSRYSCEHLRAPGPTRNFPAAISSSIARNPLSILS